MCPRFFFKSTTGVKSTHLKKGWRTRSNARKGGQYMYLVMVTSSTRLVEKSSCKLKSDFKVHIFWEGHKILRFVLCSASQINSGYFAKFCGLLRIYELYFFWFSSNHNLSFTLNFLDFFQIIGAKEWIKLLPFWMGLKIFSRRTFIAIISTIFVMISWCK